MKSKKTLYSALASFLIISSVLSTSVFALSATESENKTTIVQKDIFNGSMIRTTSSFLSSNELEEQNKTKASERFKQSLSKTKKESIFYLNNVSSFATQLSKENTKNHFYTVQIVTPSSATENKYLLIKNGFYQDSKQQKEAAAFSEYGEFKYDIAYFLKNMNDESIQSLDKNFILLKKTEKGTTKAIPHKIKDGIVTLQTKNLTGDFLLEDKIISNFIDTKNNFAKTSIDFLAERKVVSGTSTTKFSPNLAVDRATFSVMLSRALDLSATKKTPFTDIKGTWYETGVQALYEEKLIGGISSTKFDPKSTLTRQDAAVMLTRLFKQFDVQPTSSKSIQDFVDEKNISNYAKTSVEFMYNLGVMGGKSQGRFDPKGELTRAELAKILKVSLTKLNLY